MTDIPRATDPSSDNGPFDDLDAYLALPRVSGLVLSPDGTRLVTAVATLNQKKNRYVTALWELDASAVRPARRLTRGAKGESGAAFLPDGSLLFIAARPEPDGEDRDGDEDAPPALWLLPAAGGEARVVGTRPGGVGTVAVARDAGAVALLSNTLPGAVTGEDDEQRRKQRKDAKVSAILHESYPVRFWDHDLGPGQPRLLTAAPFVDADDERLELRDLTPAPGRSLDEAEIDMSADGRTVVSTWGVPEQGGNRSALVAVDDATGDRRVLLDDPDQEFGGPRVSPDGTTVAYVRFGRSTATEPPTMTLGLLDLVTGRQRDLAADWDRWPDRPVWTPDGTALVVTADEDGGSPVFRVDVATGGVSRLTGDRAAYSDPLVSPDGASVYALRATIDTPPTPVRLSATATDQRPELLRGPAAAPAVPGSLTELRATAEDGTPLRAWLALPTGAGGQAPAPLLLWIHGGPLDSWNAWSWRWNPWLAVARGYAVLLPDPALSTGYGLGMIRRGWGRWGGEPFTDLMALTDAAEAREDVDQTRTAAMGGSYGGYMANWVAGHTERFRSIVTHASLWALDQFGPTTDAYHYWRREMTAEMALANSPHRFVEDIRTPMLVIHGDKDYRVPIGEGLRLWAELAEHYSSADGEMPHKFLYFPDENHWILTPQHAKVWHQTVFAFLASTVLDRPWEVPDLLR